MNHKALIEKYYQAFNNQDVEGMLSCLHPEFVHNPNEGQAKNGKDTFKSFLHYMNEHYKENLENIVIMSDNGNNYSAKFIVNGVYLKTDGNLPEARGQKYRIPAASLFEVRDGLICQVTTYYNLKDWIKTVS